MRRILAYLFIFYILITFLPSANAQTMSNSQYKLKMGTLNSAAGESSNSSYSLNQSLGQTAPGLYTGTNYKVRAGFEYYKIGTIPFSFSISNSLIDFGIITPTNPVTRTTELTISSGSSDGFSVTVSENNPLTGVSGIIPDATCDNGDCNISKAAAWTSSLAYGFGYRCDDLNGTNCASGFSPNFYKPFAATPSAQTIMTSTTGGNSRKSQITYKVNVSGTQPQGVYTNIVTYIASPGF